MQTSIEWLWEQIPFEFTSKMSAFEVFEQAKEMHKQEQENKIKYMNNLTAVQQLVKFLSENNLIDLSDTGIQLKIDSAICKEREQTIHAHIEGNFKALNIKSDTYNLSAEYWESAENYFYETYQNKMFRDEELEINKTVQS
jgi:hypothetical protein